MTFEEMRDRLTNIQNQSAQTKMLNSILICFAEIKSQQEVIIKIQNKLNELIQAFNSKENDAETVNTDIEEDKPQEDIIDDFTDSAKSPIESEENNVYQLY